MKFEALDKNNPADIRQAHEITARALKNDPLWISLFKDDNDAYEAGLQFWEHKVLNQECITRKASRESDPSKVLGVAAIVRVLPKKTHTPIEGLGDKVWGNERIRDPPKGRLIGAYYNFNQEYGGIGEDHLHLVTLAAEGEDKEYITAALVNEVLDIAKIMDGNLYVYCPVSDIELWKKHQCEVIDVKSFPGGGQRAFLLKRKDVAQAEASSSAGPIPSIERLV